MTASTSTEHKVKISEFAFVPDNLNVKLGDKITWTNHDIVPHTASAKDGGWDSGSLKQGESQTIEIVADMDGNYFCQFHPSMTAQLQFKKT